MKQFYFIIIVLILLSCEKSRELGKLNAVPIDSRLKFEKICELDENLNFLGNRVWNLEFIDDEHFYIVTSEPSRLFLYNTKGEQLKEINRTGKGEGEYIQIGSFHEKDDHQYLWCNMTLKMNIYDKEAKIVNSFRKTSAMYDFICHDDRLFFLYYPQVGDNLISVIQ